jgi:hypothetical protein
MNYNIERINEIAQRLAEIFKVAVVQQQKAGSGTSFCRAHNGPSMAQFRRQKLAQPG